MNKLSKTINNKTINFILLLGMLFTLMLFQIKNVNAENGVDDLAVEAKIINGNQSKSDAWPWMALIAIDHGNDRIGKCGGTLVAPQWILTAAHCVDNLVRAKVLLDRNNLSGKGGEVISVSDYVVHPEYTFDIYSDADIALLHLERPSSIKPVTLANDFDFQLEEGNTALAIGWGLTHQSNDALGDKDVSPVHLQEVKLTINSSYECNNHPYLPNNVICLGVYDKKSTCNGDSGGPLLLFDPKSENWKQIGITSFGSTDCSIQDGIGVFTQVDRYKSSFIDSTINGTAQEETPEEFLAKCVKKFPDYLGAKVGEAFPCDGDGICQNTSGGRFMDIKQLFVSHNNPEKMLEFFDNTRKQWNKISFSSIGYCE